MAVIAVVAAMVPAVPAVADGRQFLVRPGDDIDSILAQAGPGDEVILWPGAHNAIFAQDLVGDPGAPIVIRGLSPDDPPVIEGATWGVRLLAARHVRLEDVLIRVPRVDGVEIAPNAEGVRAQDVTLRRVRVEEAGDRPGRHGMSFRGVDGLMIDACAIHGWTGSAIEVVACTRVEIQRTEAIGRDRGELLGIRLRGGTTHATLNDVVLERPGLGGVVAGGRSKPRDFMADPSSERQWEARAITMLDVQIVGADVALTLLGVAEFSANRCTFLDPTRAFLRLARPHDDEAYGVLETSAIGQSIFAWREARPDAIAEIAPGSDATGLHLEDNLWWGPDDAMLGYEDWPGEVLLPQSTDIDPMLDARGVPQSALAEAVGARPSVWDDHAGGADDAVRAATGSAPSPPDSSP